MSVCHTFENYVIFLSFCLPYISVRLLTSFSSTLVGSPRSSTVFVGWSVIHFSPPFSSPLGILSCERLELPLSLFSWKQQFNIFTKNHEIIMKVRMLLKMAPLTIITIQSESLSHCFARIYFVCDLLPWTKGSFTLNQSTFFSLIFVAAQCNIKLDSLWTYLEAMSLLPSRQ